MTLVSQTIAERAETHGVWYEQSTTAQAIKDIIRRSHNWDALTCSQREALEMIAVKISRILNGDPCHRDNWHDLAGYAALEEMEQGRWRS